MSLPTRMPSDQKPEPTCLFKKHVPRQSHVRQSPVLPVLDWSKPFVNRDLTEMVHEIIVSMRKGEGHVSHHAAGDLTRGEGSSREGAVLTQGDPKNRDRSSLI